MKKIIVILFIGFLFAQNDNMYSNKQISEIEKYILFKQNDRSLIHAGLFSVIPMGGHIYNKEFLRGAIIIMGIQSSSLVGLFSLKSGYTVLNMGYIMQIQDSIYLANKHNSELYKNIYGQVPPKKSIIQNLFNL